MVYTVPDQHVTKTVRTPASGKPAEVLGSIHHPELKDFAATVARVYPNGKAQLQLLVPNKSPVWVDQVAEGAGPGKFQAVDMAAETQPKDDPKGKPADDAED